MNPSSSTIAHRRLERVCQQLTPPTPSTSATTTSRHIQFVPHPTSTQPQIATADICDDHGPNEVTCLPVQWQRYGLVTAFHGPIYTVKVFEDNSLVRSTLETPGQGRILFVDGGASLRCALVGDQLANLAIKNDWRGIIVYGGVRDTAIIDAMQTGIFALGTCPVKSTKRQTTTGVSEVAVHIEGCTVAPGDYCYADADGVLISKRKLEMKEY